MCAHTVSVYVIDLYRIGGSIPVVMPYFGEFCLRTGRGRKMSMFLIFWALGGVGVSTMGWLVYNLSIFSELYIIYMYTRYITM